MPEDIQDKIQLHERLAVIETKLDQVLTQTKLTNGRVSILEIWKANITGKIAGIVFLASVIGGLIGLIINLAQK
jgi:hypothetical protein